MRRYPTSFLLLTGLGIVCAIPGAISLAGFGASFGGRYTSETAGNLLGAYEPVLYKMKAVTLWDASAHYDLNDWRLAVTASNLFDKEYVARCSAAANCFYGTRRVLTASIARKF